MLGLKVIHVRKRAISDLSADPAGPDDYRYHLMASFPVQMVANDYIS